MTDRAADYQPISCDFHDLLEVHATTRKPVRMVYRDDAGTVNDIDAVITDVFARAGADYLSLNTGATLRLDRLIEVDGVRLPGD